MGGRHLFTYRNLLAWDCTHCVHPLLPSGWVRGRVLHQCGPLRSFLEAGCLKQPSGEECRVPRLYPSLGRAGELWSKRPLPRPSPECG